MKILEWWRQRKKVKTEKPSEPVISYNLWYATHGQRANEHYWTEERSFPHNNCSRCSGLGSHFTRIYGVRVSIECKCTVVAPHTGEDFKAYIRRSER